jgi:hypothetical protein
MLLLEFDRGLFKFKLNTPLSAALFQLPPAIGSRRMIRPVPDARPIAGQF